MTDNASLKKKELNKKSDNKDNSRSPIDYIYCNNERLPCFSAQDLMWCRMLKPMAVAVSSNWKT